MNVDSCAKVSLKEGKRKDVLLSIAANGEMVMFLYDFPYSLF
jgi:hypothetical protein